MTEASLLRSAHSYADHPEKQLDQLARMLRIIPESSNHLDRPIRHFYKRMADIKPTATELGILVALRKVLEIQVGNIIGNIRCKSHIRILYPLKPYKPVLGR